MNTGGIQVIVGYNLLLRFFFSWDKASGNASCPQAPYPSASAFQALGIN